ncbi:MAG: Flp pilus assembly complex ATPase component TadA, partial [Oleispira sp.]|nr:Flp pilus assembly complex ATPase component TadA [Oleispira sp.]
SGQYRDFAFYDKQLLRHDTDVIVYGEIRDHRAAKAFCRKAETGGLALTTLHTNGVLGVPGTLIEQFNLPPAMISAPGLMRLFVHQRLLRKLCSCALPLDEAEAVYNQHNLSGEFANKQEKLSILFPGNLNCVKIVNPEGCEACGHKGEQGRLVVMEMVLLNTTDREFIAAQNYIGWEKHLASQGWPDIRKHTLQRLWWGQVDILSALEQVDNLIPVASEDIYRQMSEALS